MGSLVELKDTLQNLSNQELCFKFIDAGIACNALTVLDALGILKDLVNKGSFEEIELGDRETYPNPIFVRSALKLLCVNGILTFSHGIYRLTDFGQDLSSNIGFINLLYRSYSEAFSKQVEVALGRRKSITDLIDYKAMAQASDQLVGEDLDHVFVDILKRLRLKGTLCDLGCGSGSRLIRLCKMLNTRGLGIDQCERSLSLARQNCADLPIDFVKEDASKIRGVWEDVEVVMQCFMTHDIYPRENIQKMLQAMLKSFPSVKFVIILDVVSASSMNADDVSAPGFDYVHGLQNIETYPLDEMVQIFNESNYEVIMQEEASVVPNTYLWVLKP